MSTVPARRGVVLDAAAMRRVEARRRRRRAQVRRRRVVLLAVLGLLAFVGNAVLGGGGAGTPRAAADRSALPAPRLTSFVAPRQRVPGRRPPAPWPETGQGAIAVVGSGIVARSPHEREVPIASVTKMMTALVILADHPLALGERGPALRMTRDDAALWVADSQVGDSTLPVRAGEVLSEYQLLEGLLIPSGDNVATMLARWDAGGQQRFVERMNLEARVLGLDHTHYADASGVSPGSRSTASDQAVLATVLMADPVVRRIVALQHVPFPVAGTIWNYNPALGADGIVGVKSGFTSSAAACLVTAAYRDVGGRSVLVVVATLGQPGGLAGAATADERLLASATGALVRVRLESPRGAVATAHVAWSTEDVPLAAPELPATLVSWASTVIDVTMVPTAPGPAPIGARGVSLGTLVLHSSGGLVLRSPLVAARAIPPVPAGWTAGSG